MANTSDKVFFDANVLLDSALKRDNKAAADAMLHEAAGRAYISSLTAHLFVYFASKDISLPDLQYFLNDFIILPLDGSDVSWAFSHLHGNDFEDALQVACAAHGGCTRFVTFDRALIQRYQGVSGLEFTDPAG